MNIGFRQDFAFWPSSTTWYILVWKQEIQRRIAKRRGLYVKYRRRDRDVLHGDRLDQEQRLH